jgi:hypothetical protein
MPDRDAHGLSWRILWGGIVAQMGQVHDPNPARTPAQVVKSSNFLYIASIFCYPFAGWSDD